MNKWNDFLNEEPPQGHTERIMKAAKPELEQLARHKKSWLSRWEFLSASGALAAALVGFWVIGKRSNNSDMELVSFQESLGGETAEDMDLLLSEEDDIDLLEDLDLLEEMEDV